MKRYPNIISLIFLIVFAANAFANEFAVKKGIVTDETRWFDQNMSYKPDFSTYPDSLRFQIGQQKFDLITLISGFRKDPVLFQSSFNSSYFIGGVNDSSLALSVTGENEIKKIDSYGTDDAYMQMKPSRYGVKMQTQGQIIDLAIHYSESKNAMPDAASDYRNMTIPVRWQLVSAGISGKLAGFGVHAEGGHGRISREDSLPETDNSPSKIYDSFLIGVDYTFDNGLYLLLEYYQEGDNRAYSDFLHDDADIAGNSFGQSNKKVFVGAKYPITDMTSLELHNVIHRNTHSYILNPWVILNSGNDISIKFSADIPLQKNDASPEKQVPTAYGHIQLNF